MPFAKGAKAPTYFCARTWALAIKVHMPETPFSQDEYNESFSETKRKEALRYALDIRKFEIELYWKRASYFWTFIGATLAGFIAVQASTIRNQEDLSVILSCVGMVFSFAWYCVNRGSKHWQENWEKHVDLLEDEEIGPLYKVVLTRGDPKGFGQWARHVLTGPAPYSVSKINQLISLYTLILWVCLLFYSMPPVRFSADINVFYLILVLVSISTCILFAWLGRSYKGGYWHKAVKRTSSINNG